jgi:hypothetical protein
MQQRAVRQADSRPPAMSEALELDAPPSLAADAGSSFMVGLMHEAGLIAALTVLSQNRRHCEARVETRAGAFRCISRPI